MPPPLQAVKRNAAEQEAGVGYAFGGDALWCGGCCRVYRTVSVAVDVLTANVGALQVASAGRPEQLKVTSPVNPATPVSVSG
jgi:hypothetical protein